MLNRITSKPIRTVLRWQVYATVLIATAAGLMAGMHAAVSAILGGLANQIADLVYALLVSGAAIKTAGHTLRTLLRAGAARILLIVLLLGGVLSAYRDVVHLALFLSFAVSVVVFRMAILVKE